MGAIDFKGNEWPDRGVLYKRTLFSFWNCVMLFVVCSGMQFAVAGEALATFRDCADCPEMVELSGKGYAIGKYEVTFDDWERCLADGGCNGYKPAEDKKAELWGRGTRPVIYVSWDDAQTYIQWLSKKTGKKYRLPLEAEWEYACFGGVPTNFCGGNDLKDLGWYEENSDSQTHPVGQKRANGYGLYDMTGNVLEWVEDCWEGHCKVRGGGWHYGSNLVRATNTLMFVSTLRSYSYGFRLARTIP